MTRYLPQDYAACEDNDCPSGSRCLRTRPKPGSTHQVWALFPRTSRQCNEFIDVLEQVK